ncbi:MAG: alpha-galactosidase [Bacteroidia bacterium]
MRFVRIFLLLISVFSLGNLYSQTPVTIPVETNDYALVLQTDDHQRVNTVYFGKKLHSATEYATISSLYRMNDNNAGIYTNAYTPSGTFNLVEPALSIEHADGNLSTDLHYVSHTTTSQGDNVSLTTIHLKDPLYPVEVMLFYKSYHKENVIEQWAEIKNGGKKTITLEKYASANLYFTSQNYYLRHYHGNWAREMKPEETLLTAGIKTLDSKLGSRANLYQPPTFSVSFDRPATEEDGKVMLGTLAWSGNFKMDFEVDSYHNLRLIAGINPFSSEYGLKAGETFQTPAFIYTYSEQGTGQAGLQMHNWARDYRIPDGNGSRLTLLNNWEATYFDFDENKLVGLFQGAKKLGVDMFLLDDGWFGNKYPRNGDNAGLGDWQENRKKLPHGIGYLVAEAEKAGVKFGIWVEPEMVNPKSELYEKHPEWVIREPERPEQYFRNQLVLDLSNPAVQNFVYSVLDTLFTENPTLAFVKWDCNAVMFNAHSAYLEKKGEKQSHLYVDYVKGLYSVLERLRAKYPKVPMMLCSGGGGRVDYEALKYFTEFWLSDNTDPLERVFIQWEYSFFYPMISQCNHVTDWSKVGLKYRTDVAMMGKLGYDIVVDQLDEKDLQFSQEAVKNYQSISDVVWHGDFYRLVSPWENPFASMMSVSKNQDRAVVFNYLVTNRFDFTYSTLPVKLKGLDLAKKYRLKELNVYPGTRSLIDTEAIYSGEFLMNVGFNPTMSLRRTSVIVEVEEVK